MKKILRLKKLNELLRCHQGYTVLDLMVKLDAGERTIRKDLEEIQRPPYNAEFWYEFRGKERLYRYKDLNYSLPLFDDTDEVKEKLNLAIKAIERYKGTPQYEWLKLCLIAIENGSVLGINGIMSFDNNAELVGIEYLSSLSDAIVNKYPVRLTYQPYSAEEQVLLVHPYHLKQYNNRWFLIGKAEGKEQLQNYAVDRIKRIEHLSKHYIESDIDFEDYFGDVIGVSINDTPIEKIILKVSKKRYPYIDTKPLHSTQDVIEENDADDFIVISIDVKINNELISQLLSFGPDLEVMAPESLRNSFIEKTKKMYNKYKSDDNGR